MSATVLSIILLAATLATPTTAQTCSGWSDQKETAARVRGFFDP
jgi:hypothetical protein